MERNLTKLRHVFESPTFWGLDEFRVFSALNPDRAHLLEAVRAAADRTRHGGILVVYFAGHAEFLDGELRLATRTMDGSPESMVGIRHVLDAAHHAQAQRRMLILDCCYAASAADKVSGEWQIPGAGASGWHLIGAAAGPAAVGDGELTPFTQALVTAFDGRPSHEASLSPNAVTLAAQEILNKYCRREQVSIPTPSYTPSAWQDDAWLRNPLYIPVVVRRDMRSLGDEAARSVSAPGATVFSPWPQRPTAPQPPWIERTSELQRAAPGLIPRAVLPVTGPEGSGRRTFVNAVLLQPGIEDKQRCDPPWRLLQVSVPDRRTQHPLLAGLADALGERLRVEDDMDPPRLEEIRSSLVASLQRQSAGATLVLQLNCTRLWRPDDHLTQQLDDLLRFGFFERVVTVVTARKDPEVDDTTVLRHQAIDLGELDVPKACELLVSQVAARGGIVTRDDAEAALRAVGDRLVRLPGVLVDTAQAYVTPVSPYAGEGVSTDGADDNEPPAKRLQGCLLDQAAKSVTRALHDFDLLRHADGQPRPGPLAVLAVWSLTEGLPLPEAVLRRVDPDLGTAALGALSRSRVLERMSVDGVVHYDLGRASRRALRDFLRFRLMGDVDGLPRHWRDFLRMQADSRGADVDVVLAAAAGALFLTQVAAAAGQELDLDLATVIEATSWAAGLLADEFPSELPRLRGKLDEVVQAHRGDAYFIVAEQDTVARAAGEAAEEPRMAEGAESGTLAAAALHAAPERMPDGTARGDGQNVIASMLPPTLALLDRLYSAAAKLTICSRTAMTWHAARRALPVAEEAAAALAECPREAVSYQLVRSVDTCLHLLTQRFRLGAALADTRLLAAGALVAAARAGGGGRAGRTVAAVSWLLNTATSLVDAGRRDEASGQAEVAAALIEEFPEPSTLRTRLVRVQLMHRLERCRARCAPTPDQRLAALRRATALTAEGLRIGDGNDWPLWTARHLEALRALVQDVESAEARAEVLAELLVLLDEVHGGRNGWPRQTRVKVAWFVRLVAARDVDPVARLAGARQALELLPPVAEAQGGTDFERASLLSAAAEAHAFLAHAHALQPTHQLSEARREITKAKSLAAKAVDLAPDARTWLSLLHFVRAAELMQPLGTATAGPRRRQLRTKITEARRWLEQSPPGPRKAALDLWCIRTSWSEAGAVHQEALQDGEDFRQLPKALKRERLNTGVNRRRRVLDRHLAAYGPSVEYSLMRADLERQYQRWISVLDGTPVDNDLVFTIYGEAERRWPDEPRVIHATGAFYRYIWEYAPAIEWFERLINIAPDGDTLNQARVAAAESFLMQAQFVLSEDDEKRRLGLERALQLLNDAVPGVVDAGAIAVLRDRVRLELGEDVDWASIDREFARIIGDDYSTTIGQYLHQRRYGRPVEGSSIADLVRTSHRGDDIAKALANLVGSDIAASKPARAVISEREVFEEAVAASAVDGDVDLTTSGLLVENFTDEKLIQAVGSLYLRRAQKAASCSPPRSAASLEAATYAQRSYDCFEACRVLRGVSSDNIEAVLHFLRAQAVVAAAQAARSVDPFPWPHGSRSHSWLQYALQLLSACISTSVGGFREKCRKSHQMARELLDELKA